MVAVMRPPGPSERHFNLLAQYLELMDVEQFRGIDAARANRLYQALQSAMISLDASMCIRNEFDWMDERSRAFFLAVKR